MKKSKVLKIEFESIKDFQARTKKELKKSIASKKTTVKPKNLIRFSSVIEYQKIMSDQKYAILAAIYRYQPSSVYQLAKILNRAQPNVIRDCELLESYGFIKQKISKVGRKAKVPSLSSPYDTIVICLPNLSYHIGLSSEVA